MGIYNSDGSIAVTEVDGTELTGVQAPDGSINIVVDDNIYRGVYHPCGAFRVNSNLGNTILDPSGAFYINTILGQGFLIGQGSIPPVEDADNLTGSDGAYLLGKDGAHLLGAA